MQDNTLINIYEEAAQRHNFQPGHNPIPLEVLQDIAVGYENEMTELQRVTSMQIHDTIIYPEHHLPDPGISDLPIKLELARSILQMATEPSNEHHITLAQGILRSIYEDMGAKNPQELVHKDYAAIIGKEEEVADELAKKALPEEKESALPEKDLLNHTKTSSHRKGVGRG